MRVDRVILLQAYEKLLNTYGWVANWHEKILKMFSESFVKRKICTYLKFKFESISAKNQPDWDGTIKYIINFILLPDLLFINGNNFSRTHKSKILDAINRIFEILLVV